MEKNINEKINVVFELAKQHEQLRKEIINDDSLPKELKNELINLYKEFEQERLIFEKYIENNKHRKIIGYNIDNFNPIYED